MILSSHSLLAFLLATFLPLCLADHVIRRLAVQTRLGTFQLDLEQSDQRAGWTWTGRIPLPQQYREHPTIDLCHDFASAIYEVIAQYGDVMNNYGDSRRRKDQALFGSGSSQDLLVSAFTYSGAQWIWISSIPRGGGLELAKDRINSGRAPLLRSAMIPRGGGRVSSQIHSEENAMAIAEEDHRNGINWEQNGYYPQGAVVGTWHRGGEDRNGVMPNGGRPRYNPHVGEPFPACSGTTEFNPSKGNDYCSVILHRLDVNAWVRGGSGGGGGGGGSSSSRGGSSRGGSSRGGSSRGGGGSSRGCYRKRDGTEGGDAAACALPDPKGTKNGPPTGRKGTKNGAPADASGSKNDAPADPKGSKNGASANSTGSKKGSPPPKGSKDKAATPGPKQ